MPIYEYQCQQCEERTEVMQRISDDPLTRCESCGGDLKKLISAPAFQFKGSGWYVTDYARKDGDKGSSSGSDGGKTTAPESGGDAKSSSGSGSDGGSSSGGGSDSGSTGKSASSSKDSGGSKSSSGGGSADS